MVTRMVVAGLSVMPVALNQIARMPFKKKKLSMLRRYAWSHWTVQLFGSSTFNDVNYG